ncbi:MAG: ZIP family metal transporter [Terriglobales bacterium]
MSQIWLYALTSVSLVSVLSLMGVFAISVKPHTLARITFVLVSLATGCMLGNAIVHLIPESFEAVQAGEINSFTVSLLMLAGFLVCFAFERVLNFHCHHSGAFHHDPDGCDHEHGGHGHDEAHAHDGCENACATGSCGKQECEGGQCAHRHVSIHPLGHLSLMAHAMDNFTDGILIGATYLISIPAGIATTIAIVSHEIPMEFGGFGVLVKSGFTRWQAIFINFCSAIVATIGTLLVLYFGQIIHKLPVYLTPIGAGTVLYICAVGLIPQLQQEKDRKRAALTILIMLAGVAVMVVAKLYEPS